jgi:hypothetical protein
MTALYFLSSFLFPANLRLQEKTELILKETVPVLFCPAWLYLHSVLEFENNLWGLRGE